ncbi:MAG: VOC family protein [Pseudomonadota bacterium]
MAKNRIVHVEIGGFDGEKNRQFFGELFGWDISDKSAGYSFDLAPPASLSGHLVELGAEWGAYVTFYVEVESADASLARAGELGGKTLVPPQSLPDNSRFAWLAAPEGQIIGLWEAPADA